MDINKILEEGEKEFDENYYPTDPECEHGFMPATECPNNDCYKRKLMTEYKTIKDWHKSQQHKLLQSIVEDIEGIQKANTDNGFGRINSLDMLKAKLLKGSHKEI